MPNHPQSIQITGAMLYERLGRKEHAIDILTETLRATQLELGQALQRIAQLEAGEPLAAQQVAE